MLVWACDEDERIDDSKENATHKKLEGKRSRGRPRIRWVDHIRKDKEMEGESWEETQENRKWNS